MFLAYQNIWFCGLAASGKTTVLRLINETLKDKVEFLNDSLEMVEFVRQDTKQEHHTKPTPESFILKDSEPVYYSVKRLIEKASSSDKDKIIEISRGSDEKGIVDFSYQHLFSQLPEDLKKKSIFVYVYSPVEDRRARNKQRPLLSEKATVFESFFCPEEAFERFFVQDDFLQAVSKYPVNILFIPNIYSLDYLKDKIKKLFLTEHARSKAQKSS
ncbi:MAG: hypothetical protein COU63_04465 [Candidatus Pacebacteria bacterium CG10_big_fil_rev_8_21_14_0_10_36_11]|nr:AAA family ATPase [Candidatus Pacearchaeota archaeon]OIP74036.1 MAG: hypothetical protein AUK08_02150 [Candidatus Pacebacteria bacterium CG2_30_36_39]PIR64322.1 MAG: hypothetical protein COU63_04465 [Candidatus Pacebacteria bacterium CG10_big_fil_rev_8_21_14_0_10_36_11]